MKKSKVISRSKSKKNKEIRYFMNEEKHKMVFQIKSSEDSEEGG